MAMQRSVQKTLEVHSTITAYLKDLEGRREDVVDNITLLGTKRSTYPATVIKLRRQVARLVAVYGPSNHGDVVNDLTKLVIKNF